MSKFIGRLNDIGLGKESSRGVNVAPSIALPKTNFTVDDKVTKARSTMSFGSIAGEGNQALVAQQWAEGDIEGDVLSRSFGLLLLAAIGSVSTSGPSDSLYTHTYSVLESAQHPSLTLTMSNEIDTRRFALAMLDKLELSVVPEEVVKFTASFFSKASEDAASYTPTYVTDAKFLGRHGTVKVADDTSGLAAASALSIKSLKLSIEKNVVLDQAVGTLDPEDILNQNMMISGELELNYVDETFRNYMLNGNYKALRIDFTNTDYLIGASSYPQFTLDLSRVDFDAWERDIPNDEIATQKINFMALYDITNGNVINSCVLKNAQSSY